MAMPNTVTLTRQGGKPVEFEFKHAERFLSLMDKIGRASEYRIHSLNGVEYAFNRPDIVRIKGDTNNTDAPK